MILCSGRRHLLRQKWYIAEPTPPGLAIILSCEMLGSLIGGIASNPVIGFGAGSKIGKYIADNLKPGAVSDEIRKIVGSDDQD